MDGHSCSFSGKTTQACAASRAVRAVLLFCTGALLCARGWMLPQPLQLGEMPFQGGTCLAFLSALYNCLFPGFARYRRRRNVHQRLTDVFKSYISGVCCRPCPGEFTFPSFPAAPPCPVSLLNSPFWRGQLHDKEFLYLGGLTEATRETSGVRWGGVSYVLCETEKKKKGQHGVPGLCPATHPEPVWQSVPASVKNDSVHFVYLAPTGLDSSYLLGRCKYLDPFQNRSVLLLFRKFLFLSSLGFFFFCVVFVKIKDFSEQEAYVSTTV